MDPSAGIYQSDSILAGKVLGSLSLQSSVNPQLAARPQGLHCASLLTLFLPLFSHTSCCHHAGPWPLDLMAFQAPKPLLPAQQPLIFSLSFLGDLFVSLSLPPPLGSHGPLMAPLISMHQERVFAGQLQLGGGGWGDQQAVSLGSVCQAPGIALNT